MASTNSEDRLARLERRRRRTALDTEAEAPLDVAAVTALVARALEPSLQGRARGELSRCRTPEARTRWGERWAARNKAEEERQDAALAEAKALLPEGSRVRVQLTQRGAELVGAPEPVVVEPEVSTLPPENVVPFPQVEDDGKRYIGPGVYARPPSTPPGRGGGIFGPAGPSRRRRLT